MRTVIFLAIVGLALGAQDRGLCKKVANADIEKMKSYARTGSAAIFGFSCPSFQIDEVVFGGECADLVDQAICYGLKAEKRYAGKVVTYKLLSRDLGNMEALGNLACGRVAACFAQVRGAVETCMTENPNFVDDTIAAAELLYRQDFESQVRAFAEKESGSILGDLASMALDQFSSADDIRTFIESQLTTKVKEDAEFAGTAALTMAQNWCDNGCTSISAAYLRGLFGAMGKADGCADVSVFCGACADSASEYFEDNTIPCCIENVIQKGIKAYNYVVENYSATLVEYADAIQARMSATAIQKAVQARDEFVEQFNCVKDVYTGNENKPVCA